MRVSHNLKHSCKHRCNLPVIYVGHSAQSLDLRQVSMGNMVKMGRNRENNGNISQVVEKGFVVIFNNSMINMDINSMVRVKSAAQTVCESVLIQGEVGLD